MKTVLGNTGVFVILYILFMLPTYYLPYVGSNSFLLNAAGVAAGVGINPAFWPHLGSLIVLIVLAWFRGALVGKTWLVIFPILALVFDLVAGLSSIPLVPTVMHLLAIILGVVGRPTMAVPREASTTVLVKEETSSGTRTVDAYSRNSEAVPLHKKSLCGGCGERTAIGDRFCGYCGAPIS
jgi:hypothetical protein